MASELPTCVPGGGRLAPSLTVVNGTSMARGSCPLADLRGRWLAPLLGPPFAHRVFCLGHRRRSLDSGVRFRDQGPRAVQQRTDVVALDESGNLHDDLAPVWVIVGPGGDALDMCQSLIPANPVLVHVATQRDADDQVILIPVVADVIDMADRDVRARFDLCHRDPVHFCLCPMARRAARRGTIVTGAGSPLIKIAGAYQPFTSWRSRPACVVGLLMARRRTMCRCPPGSAGVRALAALLAARSTQTCGSSAALHARR